MSLASVSMGMLARVNRHASFATRGACYLDHCLEQSFCEGAVKDLVNGTSCVPLILRTPGVLLTCMTSVLLMFTSRSKVIYV